MFTALHIPDFLVAAALRGQEAGWRHPSAVLGGAGGKAAKTKLSLLAVNRAAREAGIRCGWPLNRALVRCPDLRVLERNAAGETALQEVLLELAEGLAAEVELTRPDTVIVDLCARQKRGGTMLEAGDSSGLELWQVVARTPDLADLAVRMEGLVGRGERVVEAGDLASLGVEALALLGAGARELEVLGLWGVRTLGDFVKLPRQALAERLGRPAGGWQEVLEGTICRLLRIHNISEKIIESIDLEYFEKSLEALTFIAKRLIQTIESNIRSKRLAVSGLCLVLEFEGGGELVRELRLAEPQVSADGMLAVVRTFLEGLRLEAAVRRMEVEARTTFATAVQREWFGRRELPQPQRWAETLGRLEALLGPGRVGIPVPPDSFKPDGFSLRPGVGGGGMVVSSGFCAELAVPLQRYRPPLVVAVASEWRGPRRWPLAVLTGGHAGRIVGWRGPFPVSGDWWDEGRAWQRMEWDVAMEGRALLRLAWLPPETWQIEGGYG